MKKLSLVILISIYSNSSFAGIPTIDAGSIAQAIAQMALQEALSEAENQVREELAEKGIKINEDLAKKARDLTEQQFEKMTNTDKYGWHTDIGNAGIYSKLGKHVNSSNIYIPKESTDLDEVLSGYANKVDDQYRAKHGLVSASPVVQQSLDKELRYRALLDEAFKENNKRFEMIEELRKQAGEAKTAQEKTDLQIAISAEQTAIMNETLRLQTVNAMKEQEARNEGHRLIRQAYEKLGEME